MKVVLGIFAGAFCLVLACACPRMDAAVFEVRNASADTSLIGIAPTNNNGSEQWVIAGAIEIPVSAPFFSRGLFKFDLTDLPTNTLILAATLELQVTRTPSQTQTPSIFGLHRMLRPWGEGDNVASTYPGRGEPADPGEATWFCAFSPTNTWAAPGGADGVDYSGIESSFAAVTGEGGYRFEFTPELAADVQEWVNQPEFNYGWMLRCNGEDQQFTARRFGSREDPDNHPKLELSYLVPPQIESAQRVGNSFHLGFTPWPGQSYVVEFRDALTNGSWLTLTNLGEVTNATPISVTDPIVVPQRFYRVRGY